MIERDAGNQVKAAENGREILAPQEVPDKMKEVATSGGLNREYPCLNPFHWHNRPWSCERDAGNFRGLLMLRIMKGGKENKREATDAAVGSKKS
jgi:hypothetical protein